MPPSSLPGAPELILDQITDVYSRQNFKSLQDYFNAQSQLYGFKFFELSFAKAESKRIISHGIGRIPRDALKFFLTGDGAFTIHWGLCTSQNLVVSASASLKVRFLLGTYFGSALSSLVQPDDEEIWFPEGSTQAAANADTSQGTLQFPSAYLLENYSVQTSLSGGSLTVTLKDAMGADLSEASPLRVSFRNPSLPTGTNILKEITTPLSITIPSGASLGLVSGVLDDLHGYLVYSGGTPQIGLVSGRVFDERLLYGTAAVAPASVGRGFLYSSVAFLSSPIRYLFRLRIRNFSGAWANPPEEIAQTPLEKFTELTKFKYQTALTSTTYTNNVEVAASLETKLYDNHAVWDGTTFTPINNGYYRIILTLEMSSSLWATGAVFRCVMLNVNTGLGISRLAPAYFGGTFSVTQQFIFEDFLQARVPYKFMILQQASLAANLTLSGNSSSNWIAGFQLGAE